VLELAVAIEVGRSAGVLPTLAALVLIAVLGALLVRRKGSAAWRSLNTSLRAGEPPSRELADATVLVAAGVLLIVPGFVTDVVALLLLLPPTRPLLRRPLERSFRRAAADRVTLVNLYGSPTVRAGGPRPGPNLRFGGDVVEGEILEEKP
jgi:UPF0716 protein FxsA